MPSSDMFCTLSIPATSTRKRQSFDFHVESKDTVADADTKTVTHLSGYIPPVTSSWSNLWALNLSHCNLTTLPDAFFSKCLPPLIGCLDLSHNSLTYHTLIETIAQASINRSSHSLTSLCIWLHHNPPLLTYGFDTYRSFSVYIFQKRVQMLDDIFITDEECRLAMQWYNESVEGQASEVRRRELDPHPAFLLRHFPHDKFIRFGDQVREFQNNGFHKTWCHYLYDMTPNGSAAQASSWSAFILNDSRLKCVSMDFCVQLRIEMPQLDDATMLQVFDFVQSMLTPSETQVWFDGFGKVETFGRQVFEGSSTNAARREETISNSHIDVKICALLVLLAALRKELPCDKLEIIWYQLFDESKLPLIYAPPKNGNPIKWPKRTLKHFCGLLLGRIQLDAPNDLWREEHTSCARSIIFEFPGVNMIILEFILIAVPILYNDPDIAPWLHGHFPDLVSLPERNPYLRYKNTANAGLPISVAYEIMDRCLNALDKSMKQAPSRERVKTVDNAVKRGKTPRTRVWSSKEKRDINEKGVVVVNNSAIMLE